MNKSILIPVLSLCLLTANAWAGNGGVVGAQLLSAHDPLSNTGGVWYLEQDEYRRTDARLSVPGSEVALPGSQGQGRITVYKDPLREIRIVEDQRLVLPLLVE